MIFSCILAFGCPPPPTPRGGWSRRYGSKARVGCNVTDQAWELKCVGDKWQGHWRNCTGEYLKMIFFFQKIILHHFFHLLSLLIHQPYGHILLFMHCFNIMTHLLKYYFLIGFVEFFWKQKTTLIMIP